MQQPKKILHILISDYITGIFGLLPTPHTSMKKHLYDFLMELHKYMNISYIHDEYNTWLNYLNLSLYEQSTLCGWVIYFC